MFNFFVELNLETIKEQAKLEEIQYKKMELKRSNGMVSLMYYCFIILIFDHCLFSVIVDRRAHVSYRNTPSIQTPSIQTPAENNIPADEISGDSMVVQSGVAYTTDEVDATKRYAEHFRSIASVRFIKINFYPSGAPRSVNLLLPRGECMYLCEYSPQSMYNAYHALVDDCEGDVNTLIKKMKAENKSCTAAFPTNHYAIKIETGKSTPPVKFPVMGI